jgi:hypothetical protein
VAVEARIEFPSPVGALKALAEPVRSAQISLPSPVGALRAVADPLFLSAAVSLPSPIGELQALATLVQTASCSLPSPVGALRGVARAYGSDWADAGLPIPLIQNYQYSKGTGLVSTEMQNGYVKRRRRWTNSYRKVTATFSVATSRLYDLEQFITTKGYDWFAMPLVVGDGLTTTFAPHLYLVRIADNPAFGSVYGRTIEVNLSLEISGDPIVEYVGGSGMNSCPEPEPEPEPAVCQVYLYIYVTKTGDTEVNLTWPLFVVATEEGPFFEITTFFDLTTMAGDPSLHQAYVANVADLPDFTPETGIPLRLWMPTNDDTDLIDLSVDVFLIADGTITTDENGLPTMQDGTQLASASVAVTFSPVFQTRLVDITASATCLTGELTLVPQIGG